MSEKDPNLFVHLLYAKLMIFRGKPIRGLYAAGNSAALIDVGSGYQSEVSNTRGIAWGWIAAHHAIKGK